jgi:chromosome segregation ATPase
MNKKWFLISGFLAIFLLSGCASLFEKERTALVTANMELRKEFAKREASLEYNQKMVAESKKEIAELEEENAQLTEQIEELKEQIAKKSAAEKAVEEIRAATKKAESKTCAQNRPLRVKILAGAKQAAKAKLLADKLTGLGYKIERIERATKPFTRTTVYHTSGVAREAKNMARKMGTNTVVKPISWKTVFNVIIAVGAGK